MIDELQAEVQKLKGKVAELRAEVDKLKVRDGLSHLDVPSLEDVRRMLQESEAEDGARQSGIVDRLGRHPTFLFEDMERELLAGGGALSRWHETTSLWRAWPVSDRPSPKWIERPEGDEGHGGRTIRGKIRHSEKTSKI